MKRKRIGKSEEKPKLQLVSPIRSKKEILKEDEGKN